MAYRLSSTDVLCAPVEGRPGWLRQRLPGAVGDCFIDRAQVDQGIALSYTDYLPSRDLVEESVIDKDDAVLTITIGLSAASGYESRDGYRFDFVGGHTTATVFRSIRGERRYRGNERVRQLRLSVDEAALQRYDLGALVKTDRACAQLMFARNDAGIQRLARSLQGLHEAPAASRLDMQIAALSLLAEQSRQLLQVSTRTSRQCADEARIQQAYELMLEQFAQPLTIGYLCAAVGLNEFKFKQGFRELFGNSPHRVLTEIRMRKARAWLEAGEQVASVAYKAGYEHPANFSAAFSRFYGCSPKAVRSPSR
ncbi:helix-turn-helix transcriptional regulator [Pseudomonas sp. ABC1]|uniref:helix-turn-helix domain-containing protein n=1 Tax=Pseudomonas sp. ABC1 TaxID=2748080 RepID=UPI0015C36F19|nr:AraC family transcriptional regulator [Pseudomonas sp. ABC1]QLF91703.1 helix-turn-helix transcriptional regulator [Pseudomonas sp. ABC1]